MKSIFSILLSLTLACPAATYWLLDKNTDGTGSKPKVTAANSTLFSLDSSGVLTLLPQSTFLTTSAAASSYQPLDADLTSWAAITPASKADDSAVVKLTGTQTITGTKAYDALQITSGTNHGLTFNNGSFTGLITTPAADFSASAVFRLPDVTSGTFAMTNQADGTIRPSSLTGLGTGISSALAINTGTAGSVQLNNGSGSGLTGTASSLTAGAVTNLTIGGATTISTGGTIALGGYTLTVPATGTAALLGASNSFSNATNAFLGGTFTTSWKSTTALATPSALSATEGHFYASTVSGASIGGYGTTNDVTLRNRAGTVCLGVGPNTTAINIPGQLFVSGNLYTPSGSSIDLLINPDKDLNCRPTGPNLYLGDTGSNRWKISSGNLTAITDNAYDIGASGATRPRSIYVASNGTFGGTLAVTGASTLTGDVTGGGKIIAGAAVRLKGYTVATLPASPTQGDTAFVTDLLTPTFLTSATGGGSVVGPVFYNGTSWVSY